MKRYKLRPTARDAWALAGYTTLAGATAATVYYLFLLLAVLGGGRG